MSDLTTTFDSLYTHLILRDLCGKIAPGTLLLAFVRAVLTSPTQVVADGNSANLGAWIVFGALAWLTGLAIQGLGEITGLTPYFPVQYIPKDKRPEDWFENLVVFDSPGVATLDDKQRFERFVVIKEAAGNGFISLLMGVSLAVIVHRSNLTQHTPSLSLAVLALLGLWKLHYANAKRGYQHLEKVIARSSDGGE